MGDRRANLGRVALTLRIFLVAVAIGVFVHFALWFWFPGPAFIFRPEVLVPMLGPALLPAAVVTLFVAASDRFDEWLWVVGLSVLIFAIEQAVFWTWRSILDDTYGFEFIYITPILGGLPLALISYAVAVGWSEH